MANAIDALAGVRITGVVVPSCVRKAILVAAGFTVRLHSRDACATCLIAPGYEATGQHREEPNTCPASKSLS